MNRLNKYSRIVYIFVGGIIISCGPEPMDNGDLTAINYNPTTYNFDLPSHFPSMDVPTNNPTTNQGVSLGRHLFYDPILSADSTMSCATCHMPEMSFTDGKAVSMGIDGIAGTRSSMSLINIAFVRSGLFWDGRAKTLEDQAALPVEDPIEMHHSWPKIEELLRKSLRYPTMFREAFGIQNKTEITKELAVKAIAQFERTIISKDSKYDKIQQGKAKYTDIEDYGQGLFFDEDPDLPDSECWHCHNLPMATSDAFFNNGLSEVSDLVNFVDKGRGNVTKSIVDNGKFRAPTLRNIKYSAPYMHDGRFANLDDVFNHYVTGGKSSPNSNPLIHTLPYSNYEIKALKAFIETLNDTTVYNNPALKSPFR